MRYLFLILISINAFATEPNNDRLTCLAKHLDTDEEVEVKINSAISAKQIATAQWPLGYPTISINDSDFIKLPKNTRQFIFYHECAHLKYKTKDENKADCKSIEMMKEIHQIKEIDVRKLVKTLNKEFGMSHRWSALLQCESFKRLNFERTNKEKSS